MDMNQKMITGSCDLYIAYDTKENNNASYIFLDERNNVVESIAGNKFRSCIIIGEPSSDRFYCVQSVTNYYMNNVSWSNNLSDIDVGTKSAFGFGKSNTAKCVEINTDKNSIFYHVNMMNQNKMCGYDDWFIPSKEELEKMRNVLSTIYIWRCNPNDEESYFYVLNSSENITVNSKNHKNTHYASNFLVKFYGEIVYTCSMLKDCCREKNVFIPVRAF